MNIIKYIILISLIINYGAIIIRLTKGCYKNNIKDLGIDLWISYFFNTNSNSGFNIGFYRKEKGEI